MRRHVGILLFPEVEVLDFAGPFEVFSVADELHEHQRFAVYTVAATTAPIRARNGLRVVPDHALTDCPPPAVLVVPGGYGTRALLDDEPHLSWIRHYAATAEVVFSVCTGSLLLARAGLLAQRRVTTHHDCVADLRRLAPEALVDPSCRYHDNPATPAVPRIVTAAGISAGIDAALHLVGSLAGAAAADRTAHYMEYRVTGGRAEGAP